MSNNILDWNELPMKQRAAYIRLGVANGYRNIDSIKLVYNEYLKGGSLKENLEEPSMEELVSRVNNSKADFVQRLQDPNRATIQDWEHPEKVATHKMGVGTDANNNVYIYPEVLNINGELIDFTRPPYAPWVGQAAAEERGDTVRVPDISTGIRFSTSYKDYYPGFDKYGLGGPLITEANKFAIGGETDEEDPTYWGGLMNEIVVRPNQEPIVVSPEVSRAYAQEDAAREEAMKQAGDMTRNIHSATNKTAPILGNILLGAQTAPLTIGLEAINQTNPTAGTIASLLPLAPTAVKGIAGVGKFGLSAARNLYRKLDPVYDFYKTTQETPIIKNFSNNFNSNYINSGLSNNSRFRKGDLFIDWHKTPIHPITAEERLGIPKGERNNVFNIKPDNIYGNIRFIRNIEGLPNIDDEGFVHLAKDADNLLANFTTDLPFRLHSWYPNISGSTYMMVSPRAFKGKRFLSIEPSDSFLYGKDAVVSPNQVRIISGDDKILEEATKRGMRTSTSNKLRQLYNQGKAATSKEYELGLNGAERPFQNSDNAANNLRWRNINMSYPKEGVVTPYRQEVDRIITENIGRPTLRDYKNLEDITGLKANYVSQYSDDLIKDANDPLASKSMFEHVFYPVTSPVENNLMESIGLYGHPHTSFSNWLTLENWLNRRNIQPLKKFGGKIFAGGGSTLKQVFLDTLELALVENAYYNTPLWRQFLTDLAERESSYRPDITNSIGAKGYFQLMPFNRSKVWTTPTLLFSEMFRLTDSNLKYINTHMTDLDWERAKQLGIDIYGLVAGAHLGGVRNALKALRGISNAKDANNTSIMDYMIRFSLMPKSPSKIKQDASPQTSPVILTYQPIYESEITFPLEIVLDLGQNIPNILIDYPQINTNVSYQDNPFESLELSSDIWDIMEGLNQSTPIQLIYKPRQSSSVYELLKRMGYQDSLNSLLGLLEELNYIRNKK